jgi:hypothetical protein
MTSLGKSILPKMDHFSSVLLTFGRSFSSGLKTFRQPIIEEEKAGA